MTGGSEIARKAIPSSRDRMQSDLLTGAVGAPLALKIVFVGGALHRLGLFPVWFWGAGAVSLMFALLVWTLRSATGPAAVLGGWSAVMSCLRRRMAARGGEQPCPR